MFCSGTSESTEVFLFTSAGTKLCLSCVNTNFSLNRPNLPVHTREGTRCPNLGFVISSHIKPKHFRLCLPHIDQLVLVGSGDAYTVPGDMEGGKEHYRREKWSHLHQAGQALWRSALMSVRHCHKMTLTSSISVLSHRWQALLRRDFLLVSDNTSDLSLR